MRLPGTRAAVLGHPIGHSKSPLLHGAAYAHLGLQIDYTRIDVPAEELDTFLAERGHEPGWLGWSVTMPLKSAMVPHMSRTSQRVRDLGVLNTVVHTSFPDRASALFGENTDVDGILRALSDAGAGSSEQGRPTAREAAPAQSISEPPRFGILGAGGTAPAALAAAREMGFSAVTVFARAPERAAWLMPIAQRLGLTLEVEPLSILPEEMSRSRYGVVVSALPPHAADHLADQLGDGVRGVHLLDVAYDPWPSALAQGWEAAAGVVVSGLEMLLHQAVRQVELFTGARDAGVSLVSGDPVSRLTIEEHAAMVASMRSAIGLQSRPAH